MVYPAYTPSAPEFSYDPTYYLSAKVAVVFTDAGNVVVTSDDVGNFTGEYLVKGHSVYRITDGILTPIK